MTTFHTRTHNHVYIAPSRVNRIAVTLLRRNDVKLTIWFDLQSVFVFFILNVFSTSGMFSFKNCSFT